MKNDNHKITAIIFDCFGVLVSEGWLPFKHKYFGDDPDKFKLATAAQKRADGGLVDHTRFVEEVAKLAGVSLVEAHKQIDHTVTDQALLKYIASLRPKYKIGFISNASQNWMGSFFTPEQTALFDQVSVSSETGFLKPDPRAYEHIANLLNAPLEQCVLIDDQPVYCDGARGVGMNAIQYTNLSDLKRDLGQLLG
jgi:HAD superfamily hydrolase (TIGR01509 family)